MTKKKLTYPMEMDATLCELNIYVCVLPIFFEFYIVRLYLNDWAASTPVVDIAHAIAKLTNYVYVYEREIYQNAICNAHRMDQLDRLLHCVPRIISLLSARYKNNILHYKFIAQTLKM